MNTQTAGDPAGARMDLLPIDQRIPRGARLARAPRLPPLSSSRHSPGRKAYVPMPAKPSVTMRTIRQSSSRQSSSTMVSFAAE